MPLQVPTIVDPAGPDGGAFTVFESGAILLYLGEKVDAFLGGPPGSAGRHTCVQWLMFQMASVAHILKSTLSSC
jgi:GST-like protein